jgi:hypothetical protein
MNYFKAILLIQFATLLLFAFDNRVNAATPPLMAGLKGNISVHSHIKRKSPAVPAVDHGRGNIIIIIPQEHLLWLRIIGFLDTIGLIIKILYIFKRKSSDDKS